MSWKPLDDADRRIDSEHYLERVDRLKTILAILRDAGIDPLHENCHNYGGQSWRHTLRLVGDLPGLGLIFDSANPIGSDDMACGEPRPKQSPWIFYQHVVAHVRSIHIKDAIWEVGSGSARHVFPGCGEADLGAILQDALARNPEIPVAMEPHLGAQRLLAGLPDEDAVHRRANVVAFCRRFESLVAALRGR